MSISPLVKAEQRMRAGVWSMLVAAGWFGGVAAGLIWPGAASAAEREVTDSIGRLKPVHREERFEFTRKPAVKKTGDGAYEISFASAGRCDVAVAVEDTDGRMVRHLVYGVLGSNAPEPFQKDSLEQTVVWDGKDDMGRPTSQPDRCRVRVSLGLNPTLDRFYSHHPKDAPIYGSVQGLAADEHGVYVLQRNVILTVLRMFDHQARYVRTLIPFSGQKLGRPEMDVPTVEVGGRLVPSRYPQVPGFLFRVVGCSARLAAAAGWVVVLGDDGHILRLREDGTTGGESYVGPMIPLGRHKPGWGRAARVALSPDGKWVYVTGLMPGVPPVRGYRNPVALEADAWQDRVVFRAPRDAENAIEELQPFIGTMDPANKDAAPAEEGQGGPSWFQGLACDGKGQVYVCDYAQDLIRVYDPKGKPVTTIPVANPREIDVHKKTGEIYVLCEIGTKRPKPKEPEPWGKGVAGKKIVLRKLGALDDPKPLMEQEFEFTSVWAPTTPLLCVDSWSDPTRVWVLHHAQSVRVYVEKDGRLELEDDFAKDVLDAGLIPCRLKGSTESYDKFRVDPVTGHLYLRGGGTLFRCDDWAGPGKLITVRGIDSNDGSPIEFSADGLLHFIDTASIVRRVDPAKARIDENRQYGRYVLFGPDSFVPFAQADEKIKERGFGTLAVMPNGTVTAVRKALIRWDRDGRILSEDLLPGLRECIGLGTDLAGSVYLGFGPRGKYYPPPEFPARLSPPVGLVAKFDVGSKTQGGNELSAKPGQTERLWSCPNYNTMTLGCECNNAQFDADRYGRCFIPQAIPATIAVVDTNGNRICEVGRYGNVDDPPDPATSQEPIKGAEIRVAWCMRVTTFPDKWLYILDDCNMRITRVRLGYQTEERLALP